MHTRSDEIDALIGGIYGVVFTVAIVEVARVGDVGDGTVSEEWL